jgi:hypothetical protein
LTAKALSCMNPLLKEKLWMKKCTMRDILRHLRDEARRKLLGKIIYPSRQCSSTSVSSGQRFRSKVKCIVWNTPHNLLTWFQLNFICSVYWSQHWRNGVFVMLLTLLIMRRKGWKALQNGFQECFQKLESLSDGCSCTSGPL